MIFVICEIANLLWQWQRRQKPEIFQLKYRLRMRIRQQCVDCFKTTVAGFDDSEHGTINRSFFARQFCGLAKIQHVGLVDKDAWPDCVVRLK
jgi:hypothetical protein